MFRNDRSMALMQVQSWGGGNPSLSPGRATGVVPDSVDSASTPVLPGRGIYLPTQSQASYRSASSSPLARRSSSCFDVDNKEANARKNVVVADGNTNVGSSNVWFFYDNVREKQRQNKNK